MLREGPWSWYDCERICRLYTECQAFAMDWLDWEKVKGYCTLINHKVKPEEVTSNTTSSIFGMYVA